MIRGLQPCIYILGNNHQLQWGNRRRLFFARLCFPSLPNTNSQVLIPNSCALAKIHKVSFLDLFGRRVWYKRCTKWGYREHVYLCYQLVQLTDDSEQSTVMFCISFTQTYCNRVHENSDFGYLNKSQNTSNIVTTQEFQQKNTTETHLSFGMYPSCLSFQLYSEHFPGLQSTWCPIPGWGGSGSSGWYFSQSQCSRTWRPLLGRSWWRRSTEKPRWKELVVFCLVSVN